MKLCSRIRWWRNAAGLTQSDLAKHVGVTSSAVAQWEAEQGTEPTHGHLDSIAKAAGVTLAEFWRDLPDGVA